MAITASRGTRAAKSTRIRGRGAINSHSPAHRHDGRLAWVLIAPALVGFVVFFLYPTLRGIYLSFTDFKVLTPPTFTGFDNFVRLFGDQVFWSSLGVTVYFVLLSVVFGMTISLVTAVVLHRLTSNTVVRGIIILPFLISGVVAATTWSWMLDSQLGVVNMLIEQLTGEPILFLGSRAWAIPSIAMISVWKSMGYNAIIIFAGLQTIPPTIYEAGRIDGANEVQMFRRLTLPLLRPILAMVLVLTVIGSFQVFDIVAVTTKGGPANASNVLQMYIYDKAFGQFDFGYGATMSLALFAMLIIITFLQMRLMRASESDTN
ncbi:sugar ABC transporter permease [Herbiconiux sp. VKM Ac-1786]|jgi:multiple sugar transport system permease protein|uniref:carbohydrate ABC transporter permease n=1 Tax=Herbiconiux sp. VKM Ac-1786 TaxID=2783824 RepID=UPI00188AFEBF|nr:sugar ABC transporter permease [Herbiconiux sp. VKM Ac-1786]MBF4572552.1 sugar ABC transporter permease [Herbiconiux sp. VKM Ac-1786]